MVPLSGALTGGLADRLREHTRDLHASAERSGVVRTLIAGSVSRGAYALYLRNLLPAYRELESGVARHRGTSVGEALGHPALARSAAIESDLAHLEGGNWMRTLEVLPEALAYADRIARSAGGSGLALVAHAYTRYLGDLSGGRLLSQMLSRSAGFPAGALAFYEYAVSDLNQLRTEVRGRIDAIACSAEELPYVLDECREAFRLNIALSEATAARMEEGA